MEYDDDVRPPASILPPTSQGSQSSHSSVEVQSIESVPNRDIESDSELEVLIIHNVSGNVSKEELINFNPFGVGEQKQLCSKLGLHLEQESL